MLITRGLIIAVKQNVRAHLQDMADFLQCDHAGQGVTSLDARVKFGTYANEFSGFFLGEIKLDARAPGVISNAAG